MYSSSKDVATNGKNVAKILAKNNHFFATFLPLSCHFLAICCHLLYSFFCSFKIDNVFESAESTISRLWLNEGLRNKIKKTLQEDEGGAEHDDSVGVSINSFIKGKYFKEKRRDYQGRVPVFVQVSADSISLYPHSKFGQYALAPCFIKFLQLDAHLQNDFVFPLFLCPGPTTKNAELCFEIFHKEMHSLRDGLRVSTGPDENDWEIIYLVMAL